MKLPGIRYGRPVQSLGRFDAQGPMRAANAAAAAARANAQAAAAGAAAAGGEAEAARSAGRAIATVQSMAMSLYEANAAAEYDHALAEYQKHEKMLRTMLTSSPVIDTTRWAIPDWVAVPGGKTERVVDETGKTQDVPRRYVPTHEVASQIYNGSMERVTSAVQSGVRNPLAARQLRRKLPAMQSDGAARVAAKQHEYYVDHQKGLVSAAIEEFTQAGDERSAMLALQRAHHTGLIDRDEFVERHAEIGFRIDQLTYDTMLMAASENPEDVEQVQDYLEQGMVPRINPETGEAVWTRARVPPDERWKLRQRAQTMLDQAEKARNQRHKDNAQGYGEALLKGQLTRRALAAGLNDDKLSLTQALTLDNALRAREKAGSESDTGARDYFLRQARSVRHLQQGERQSEKVRQLEVDLQAALTGIYPNGREYNGPRLDPADHDKALAALRAEERAVAQQPDYKQALGIIRGFTGYSEYRPAGEGVNDLAHMQFKQALDDYMDRTGAEADPLSFVEAHAKLFDVNIYAGKNLQSFAATYPREFGEQYGYMTEEEMKAGAPETYDKIRAGIAQRVWLGTLTEERARIMAIHLTGEPLADEVTERGAWLIEQTEREDATHPDPAGEVLP